MSKTKIAVVGACSNQVIPEFTRACLDAPFNKPVIVFEPTGKPNTRRGDDQLTTVQAAQKAVGRELSITEIATIAQIVTRDAHLISVDGKQFRVELVFNGIDPDTVITERGEKMTDDEKRTLVAAAENHRANVHNKMNLVADGIESMSLMSGKQRRRVRRELKRKNNK